MRIVQSEKEGEKSCHFQQSFKKTAKKKRFNQIFTQLSVKISKKKYWTLNKFIFLKTLFIVCIKDKTFAVQLSVYFQKPVLS